MNKKDTKLSGEDINELEKVFSLLFKWDMEQNPHLYKKKQDATIN